LDDFEGIIGEMKEQAMVQRGRAIVACVPSIAASVFPNILARFMKEHPGVSVQICDDRAEVIEQRLTRGEVDFAVSPSGSRNTELEFEHIIDDPYFAVFPKTHPFAQGRTVSLRRFAGQPLVLMRPELNMRHVLDKAAAAAGVTLRPAHEVYHHDTLTGIVAAGLAIGAMPSLTISMARRPHLAMARIVDPGVARAIGLLKRRGEPLTPAAQHLADATRKYLQLAAAGPQTASPLPRRIRR
jgi:DNA-binding transcriptional LysR family regulator